LPPDALRRSSVCAKYAYYLQREYGIRLPRRVLALTPVLMLVLATAFLVVGLTVDVLEFRYGGLVGAMLPDDVVRFSAGGLLNTITLVSDTVGPDSVSSAASLLAKILAVCLVAVVPIAAMVVSMILWVRPLRPTAQWRLVVAVQTLYAWAAHDIFLICVLVTTPDLHKFLDFTLEDKCKGINALLGAYFADVLEEPTCFTVDAAAAGMWWFLLIATVLSLLCPAISVAAEKALCYY